MYIPENESMESGEGGLNKTCLIVSGKELSFYLRYLHFSTRNFVSSKNQSLKDFCTIRLQHKGIKKLEFMAKTPFL